MPDFGRPDFGKPAEPSLDEIRRSDSVIDALAGGRSVAPHDAADAELAALLGSWRDETRWPPATGLITESDAIAALNAGRAQRRSGTGRDRLDPDAATTPRRRPRGLSVIGATAAAVLCIGGFGAVVAGAGPGDGLYGVRSMLFGTPKQVRDDQVGLAARTQLNQVQDLISRGDWQQAQDKLVEVSTQVASIGDQQQKQDLLEQFNDLSAKVVERDPAATAPPGVVYTVPPSSAELVPAVAPTSTPSAPPVSPSTTPTTSTAPPTSAAPVTSATPTSPTTSAPGTSTESPAPGTAPTTSVTDSASSVPPSSASSPATSAAPSAQSQPTTTPTSAAPTTSVTAAPPAAESTSAAPAPTAAVTTTAAVERSASPTGESSTAAPAESPAGSAPAPLPESVVTTTVVIPVPIG
jgi:hypothetical protein